MTESKLYMDKEWLEDQYINKEKSQRQIAEECKTTRAPIRHWMKKFNIKQRNRKESLKISQNRQEVKKKISEGHKGNKAYNWKGNNITYNGLHWFIRRHKHKPEVCEICGEEKKLELSCKDHKYSRNIDDYQYICRSCHIKYDKERGLKKR